MPDRLIATPWWPVPVWFDRIASVIGGSNDVKKETEI
jgi:hypothetical protein